jgi:hypothetical protein
MSKTGFFGGNKMHLLRKRGEWVVMLITVCAVLSACGLKESSPLTVQGSGSVSATAIVVVEPSTESTQPTSRLLASDKESSLLTYLGGSAPIFTYNSENDVLLAYCYGTSSAHLPYDLSSGVPVDGLEHPVYVPDLGIDVRVYFDSGFEIWRVFVSMPGASEMECIVYIDDPAITDRTENLRREVLPGAQPRYYSMESGLYYSYEGKTKEISVDLNGDGTAEKVAFEKNADHEDGTSDFSIRINGEMAAELLQARSMEGAFETDVYANDAFREIAFEYLDATGKPATLLMRYDGNSIRTAVFYAWIDCAGNGTVLLRSEEEGFSAQKFIADQWFRFVILSDTSGMDDTEVEG